MSLSVTPQQARSKLTKDLLCDAAEQLLREGGLECCTVQEVARRSGRSVGSIYRRFGDKNGMLSAVMEHYVARAMVLNADNLAALASLQTLDQKIKVLVSGAIEGRSRDWRLVEALRDAAKASGNERLREAVAQSRRQVTDLISGAILSSRDEILGPDPDRAAALAVSLLTSVVDNLVGAEPCSWSRDELCGELSKVLLSYLKSA